MVGGREEGDVDNRAYTSLLKVHIICVYIYRGLCNKVKAKVGSTLILDRFLFGPSFSLLISDCIENMRWMSNKVEVHKKVIYRVVYRDVLPPS